MSLGFTSAAVNNAKSDELKRVLLSNVEEQKAHIMQLANRFYAESNLSDQDYINLCQEIITAIDAVLAAGDWEDSLFLRNTVKPLKEVKQRAQHILEQVNGGANVTELCKGECAEDQTDVYISLFQNNGLDLHQWELQLRSIDSYLSGRPVYAKEDDIQCVLRQKTNQVSHAYIVVRVQKSALCNNRFSAERYDRSGNLLINLAPNSVTSNNIVELVHQGNRYQFINGKLKVQNAKVI